VIEKERESDKAKDLYDVGRYARYDKGTAIHEPIESK
jgi:hypothetical protein